MVVQRSIEVNAPVREVYEQWTRVEDFPQFMHNVESVQLLDDARLHWRAKVGGQLREWDAIITERDPDSRFAWRDGAGIRLSGMLMFEALGESRTRVVLNLEYLPAAICMSMGEDPKDLQKRTGDYLNQFKQHMEHGRARVVNL